MNDALLQRLVDPIDHEPLRCNDDRSELTSESGRRFPIVRGIPRFVELHDAGQEQTSTAFAFKWAKRDTYDSPAAKRAAAKWYLQKYGFDSLDDWAAHLDGCGSILDAGCGSGFSSSLWLESPRWTGRSAWIGADISAAVDVAQERLAPLQKNTHYVQADVLQLPFADGAFGAIFSEGVLHHTPSTRAALLSVARVLAPGGEALFYVYKKKSPVREFTDDYVRDRISSLSDEEAWDEMRSLTELGRVLSETHASVELKTAVPLLGIPAGTHDVQRLIYWNFAKLYWNADLTFEENVHVNFDWYRPRYAHRQTDAEVRAWCEKAALDVLRLDDGEAGYAVRAVKR